MALSPLERGHRDYKHREGCVEHNASQGHRWFRRRYPHYDQGGFPDSLVSLENHRVMDTYRIP